MKPSISILVGLAMAVAVTVASAQDVTYSSKPWLHPRQLSTRAKAPAAPSVALQDYSSKPWLRREREFQVALFPEGATAPACNPVARSEIVANPKDSSSKSWLR
jgi:hypothetical protein